MWKRGTLSETKLNYMLRVLQQNCKGVWVPNRPADPICVPLKNVWCIMKQKEQQQGTDEIRTSSKTLKTFHL